MVAGDYRHIQCHRQFGGRLVRGKIPQQIYFVLDVCFRTCLILAYLMMPRTDWTFYLFAFGLGLTWLATVPPTAAITGKLFGVRYLATLFGLTLLSHQIGGFFGAYLGGIAITAFGDYNWMWYADMVLAGIAALLNLPIREAKMGRTQEASAKD